MEIRDTAKSAQEDPMGMFREMMGANSVERQEARGQQELVNSSELPKKGLDFAICEAIGIQIGERTDDLFCKVTLPEGWKLEATDHSMWSNLLDAQGYIRANIFYKAAFYDRAAHITFVRRFRWLTEYFDQAGKEELYHPDYKKQKGVVKDSNGNTIFETEWKIGDKDFDRGIEQQLQEEVKSWLETNYPDWENVLAYWEE